jgi:hypothetical protein
MPFVSEDSRDIALDAKIAVWEPPAKARVTEVSLELDPETTLEEWRLIGESLLKNLRRIQWYIGDWMNFASTKTGWNAWKVAETTGYDLDTLREFMRVAKAFPPKTRRLGLSWTHHQSAAAVTDEILREKLLVNAESYKQSVKELRRKLVASSYRPFEDERLIRVAKGLGTSPADLLKQIIDDYISAHDAGATARGGAFWDEHDALNIAKDAASLARKKQERIQAELKLAEENAELASLEALKAAVDDVAKGLKAATEEGSTQPSDERDYQTFLDQARDLTSKLSSAGLKPSPGKTATTKVKKYILSCSGHDDLRQLTPAERKAVLSTLTDAMAGPDGNKKAVELIESKAE